MRLEDEAEATAAELRQSALAELGDLLALDTQRGPGLGLLQRPEDLQQGRLARTTSADDGDNLARLDAEVNALEHLERAEVLVYVSCL